MEFFLEMLLTALVALLFSFLVAKLVSASMAAENSGGGVHDWSSDQAEKTEIGVGDDLVAMEELRFGFKMDAQVIQSERELRAVVDENVERVDRFGNEAVRAVDEVEEAAKGEDLVVSTAGADESLADVSPENVIAKEMIVRGEDELRHSSGEKFSEERKELIVRTVEAESTASFSPENVIAEENMKGGQEEGSASTEGRSAENVRSGEVVVSESEEVSVEESNTVEESEHKMELNTEEEEGENEETEELSIEEDDDWEGIERSELEKAFAAASNLLEESGKAEEISAEAKMELYGLHKIATEGSCRDAQPMAVMVSARARWNAWQKLGNMSQEEAMEQYLALVSKEIPDLMNTGHTVGKMPETETSVVLPPNSGSLEEPAILDTTGAAASKNVEN